MGLVWAIASLTSVAVQLSRNRRVGNSDIGGDVLLGMPLFLQRIDLLSLILGQRVVFPHEGLHRELLVKRAKGNIPVNLFFGRSQTIALMS